MGHDLNFLTVDRARSQNCDGIGPSKLSRVRASSGHSQKTAIGNLDAIGQIPVTRNWDQFQTLHTKLGYKEFPPSHHLTHAISSWRDQQRNS